MEIYVIGVNEKTCAVEKREQLSICAFKTPAILQQIMAIEGVLECCLLSTCNRTELHLVADDTLCIKDVIRTLCTAKNIDYDLFKSYFYHHIGHCAISHLFSVASGLDSMIVFEDQILGQFKNAYETARLQGTTHSILNTLSRHAITAAKKTKTAFTAHDNQLSIAFVAVQFLQKQLGCDCTKKAILLIGTGNMGKALLHALRKARFENITMTKRSHGRSAFIEHTQWIDYDTRYHQISKSDVVISATASPHFTITRDLLLPHIKNPLLLLDLAVPRDIDPLVETIDNICYDTLDHLKDYQHAPLVDFGSILQSTQHASAQFACWLENRMIIQHLEKTKPFNVGAKP